MGPSRVEDQKTFWVAAGRGIIYRSDHPMSRYLWGVMPFGTYCLDPMISHMLPPWCSHSLGLHTLQVFLGSNYDVVVVVIVASVNLTSTFSMCILSFYTRWYEIFTKCFSNQFVVTCQEEPACKTINYHYLPISRTKLYIHMMWFSNTVCMRVPNQVPKACRG